MIFLCFHEMHIFAFRGSTYLLPSERKKNVFSCFDEKQISFREKHNSASWKAKNMFFHSTRSTTVLLRKKKNTFFLLSREAQICSSWMHRLVFVRNMKGKR